MTDLKKNKRRKKEERVLVLVLALNLSSFFLNLPSPPSELP